MEDNSAERTHHIFFYGLYMDPEILASKGVPPRNPRNAFVHGHELRIGKKATLLRKEGAKASGMVYSLTHPEIEKLYRGAGLIEYFPESILAEIQDGNRIPVLCCNLLSPPEDSETNPDYEDKLRIVKNRLGIIE